MPPLRLILVEDEDLYRDLLRIALTQHQQLAVVGSYATGEAALAEAESLRPDVAVLDIELKGALNGVQVGVMLRRTLPEVGIVLLSNHADPAFIRAVPEEMASGWSYLMKKSLSDVAALERAIGGAAGGLVSLDPSLVAGLSPRPSSLLVRLSDRQRQILELIAQGYTNAAIAQRLIIAEKSVENQINTLYQHLEIDRKESAAHPRVVAVLRYLEESRASGR